MKIAVCATHSFPLPYENLHTGDQVILDLANELASLKDDQNEQNKVYLVAPDKSKPNDNVTLLDMQASYGKYPPSSQECELHAFNKHEDILRACDVVHDFSNSKIIADNIVNKLCWDLNKNTSKHVVSTIMGGPWTHDHKPHNLVGWSKSHADRIVRGATDYEGTLTPNLAGQTGRPLEKGAGVQVVHGGIDTKFYTTDYINKKDYFLWLNRWHPAKGYREAIALAKKTGIKLVMSGESPKNEMFDYQRECALEAVELAKGASNITFEYLPPDPDHHNKKVELYQRARALIYSVQFCEPFGLSQTEALACGTPVVGINYGSVSEVIEDGVTGYVRHNNLDDLANAISMIDKIDPRTCREHAVAKYDISVMARSYMNLYSAVKVGRSW